MPTVVLSPTEIEPGDQRFESGSLADLVLEQMRGGPLWEGRGRLALEPTFEAVLAATTWLAPCGRSSRFHELVLAERLIRAVGPSAGSAVTEAAADLAEWVGAALTQPGDRETVGRIFQHCVETVGTYVGTGEWEPHFELRLEKRSPQGQAVLLTTETSIPLLVGFQAYPSACVVAIVSDTETAVAALPGLRQQLQLALARLRLFGFRGRLEGDTIVGERIEPDMVWDALS